MQVAYHLIDVSNACSDADSGNVVRNFAPVVEAKDEVARELVIVVVWIDEVVFRAKAKGRDW